MDIINAYADWFCALPRDSSAAVALSSPTKWCSSSSGGDHLSRDIQELVTPPQIVQALSVLLVLFSEWAPGSGSRTSVRSDVPVPATPNRPGQDHLFSIQTQLGVASASNAARCAAPAIDGNAIDALIFHEASAVAPQGRTIRDAFDISTPQRPAPQSSTTSAPSVVNHNPLPVDASRDFR